MNEQFTIVDFHESHAMMLDLQPAQYEMLALMSEQYMGQVKHLGPAFTAMSGDRVIGCGGLITLSPLRQMLWCLLSIHARKHLLRINRVTSRFLDAYGQGRVEAVVKAGFKPGCRFMKTLKFSHAGHSDRVFPDGSGADVFVRYCS